LEIGNVFDDMPPTAAETEAIDVLVETENVRIERIVSRGQASPEDFWYDQDRNEWVALLSGKAALLLDGEPEAVVLDPGDHIVIPAHRKHRVLWTDRERDTVWLAVFY
jgi:cupin 2 domain-containing protein